MKHIIVLRIQLVVFFSLALLGLAVSFTGTGAKGAGKQNRQNVANTRAGVILKVPTILILEKGLGLSVTAWATMLILQSVKILTD